MENEDILSIFFQRFFLFSAVRCSAPFEREKERRDSQYGGHHAATWWRAVHTAGTP